MPIKNHLHVLLNNGGYIATIPVSILFQIEFKTFFHWFFYGWKKMATIRKKPKSVKKNQQQHNTTHITMMVSLGLKAGSTWSRGGASYTYSPSAPTLFQMILPCHAPFR